MTKSQKTNKTNKNKAKQEAYKKSKLIRANVARANRCENPLQESLLHDDPQTTLEINIHRQVDPSEKQVIRQKIHIYFDKSPLKEKQLESCLGLFQNNMGEMYKRSSWGLNMKEKKDELMHPHARFLIVTGSIDSNTYNDNDVNQSQNSEEKDTILAFAHFRFEVDDEDEPSQEVLYLYELQIDSLVQRNGLGKRLMHIIEMMAAQMKMRKVMLTVFKSNLNAMNFYESLSYSIDDTSPSQFGEDVDYEILSKTVHKDDETCKG